MIGFVSPIRCQVSRQSLANTRSVRTVSHQHSSKMVSAVLFLLMLVGCLSHEDERGHFYPIRPPVHHHSPRQTHRPPPSQYPMYENRPIIFEGDSNKNSSPMEVMYGWKQLDFTFPNDSVREQMINNQQYIPINNMILDTDIYEQAQVQRIFVSLPRVRPGIPVTLATVSQQRRNGEYLLRPFPDWATHNALNEGRCDDGITSVFRMHIDECGRLWVLDSGSLNAFNGNATIGCQPKIWIYDLRNNNKLIGKFPIPQAMIATNSLLVTIAVDIRQGQCGDAFAYVADAIAYKMIVFNLRTREFWRVNSIQFFAFPDQSRFDINGESFDLFGGIFGLALGPLYGGDKRILYFNSIDSIKQSWVDTGDLRNQSLWRDNMNAKPRAFNLFNGTRSSQSTAAAMSDQGVMFFGLVGSNEVACWNTQTKFEDTNIVRLAKDDVGLQFVSGVKLSRNKLYVVSGRLQKYMNRSVRKEEVNYRVLVGDLQSMTQGTKCQVDIVNNRLDGDYAPNAEWVEEPADLLALKDF